MGQREYAIAQGLASGIERASANLLNFRMAKDKLMQDRERADTEHKIRQLQLKNLQLDPDTDPENIKRINELNDLKHKKEKSELDFWLKTTDQRESVEKTKLNNISQYANLIEESLKPENLNEPTDLSKYVIKEGGVWINSGGKNKGISRAQFDSAMAIAVERIKGGEPVEDVSQELSEQFPTIYDETKHGLNLSLIAKKYYPKKVEEKPGIFDRLFGGKSKTPTKKPLFSRAEEKAMAQEMYQRNINKTGTMERPDFVPEAAWNAATEEEKLDFLNKLNSRGR